MQSAYSCFGLLYHLVNCMRRKFQPDRDCLWHTGSLGFGITDTLEIVVIAIVYGNKARIGIITLSARLPDRKYIVAMPIVRSAF